MPCHHLIRSLCSCPPDEEIPSEPGRGQVYVLVQEDGKKAKIGKTINLESRIRALGLLSPQPLHLVALIDGYSAVETWFHRRFKHLRVHGEWFTMAPELQETIDGIKAGTTAAQLCPHALVEDGFVPIAPDIEPEVDPEIAHRRARLAELMALRQAIHRRKMRESLAEFVKEAHKVLEPGVALDWNWHHQQTCDHVQYLLEEWRRSKDPTYRIKVQNLVINGPPGSYKSQIVMVFAVAWMWIDSPEWAVICTSINAGIVSRDSHKCRDLVTSGWYRETFKITWTIRDDVAKVSKWMTTAGGSRVSQSLTTSSIGLHGDAIFCDDPDDAKRVWGEPARKETRLAWSAMGSRVNDLSRVIRIMVQQRVHEDDLSANLDTSWQRLIFALEFNPKKASITFLGFTDERTSLGEILQATRYMPEVVAAERLRLGTHGFEAQYNQDPQPLDGGMFSRQWFQFFAVDTFPSPNTVRPDGCRTILESPTFRLHLNGRGAPLLDWLTITIDSTFGSLTDAASAIGFLVIGGQKMNRFIFDDQTKVGTFLDVIAMIRAAIACWPARTVLIELKANGSSVISRLKELMANGEIKDATGKSVIVAVEGLETGRDNYMARAAAMMPAIQAGTVYLLEGAHWLKEFLGEVCVFPNAKRDDRVDALAQLMKFYADKGGAGPTAEQWRIALGGLLR